METEILKFVLSNQGAVNTDELLFNLCDASTLSEIISKKDMLVSCQFYGQPKVVARSRLRLCKAKDCQGCGGLHLCKNFLLSGSCRFSQSRRGCTFSHDLHSFHNVNILRESGLETLNRTELCVLLLQSDYTLLPSICHDYNNGVGLNGQCRDDCQRLHICEKYLSGDCGCFRTHDFFAPQPLKCLREKHVPDILFTILKSVYANKEALWLADRTAGRGNRGNRSNWGNGGSNLARAASCGDILAAVNLERNSNGRQNQRQRDKREICMYFIKGHCRHEDRCFKAHDKMPYKWEVKQDGKWTPMADNEKIEQDYCDPKNTYSNTCPAVHFDTMTFGTDEVRRLSTINSVLEPDFIHTTDWLWYWEDEYGKWYQYAAVTSEHRLASITSKQLEEMFVKNDKDVVEFTAGSHTYSISFQDMIQTNIKFGTKRLVRRRPLFVSAAEVQTKRRRPLQRSTAVPDHWDKTQTPQTGYKRVSLVPSSDEYKEIQELFSKTMPGFDILKIERIQNKVLWEAFQLQKNHMKINNGGQPVTEKKLFHGTDPNFIDTICAVNFDWRVCGVNGTAYGQGSYFARDAKYSHRYTGNSDLKSMFVSRVLVGDYTKGCSEYRRPPSKDDGNINLYDSCVDNVINPSIFVVFEKQQIYPEYLLQYEQRSQDMDLFDEGATRLRNRLVAPVPTITSPLIKSLIADLTVVSKPIAQTSWRTAAVTTAASKPLQKSVITPVRRHLDPPKSAYTSNPLMAPIPINVPKPTLTPTTSVTAQKPLIAPKPLVIPPCFTKYTSDSQPSTSSSRTTSASYLYTLDYLKNL